MAITINHQTNDIHISEGSALTFAGAEMPTSGGGGGDSLGTITNNDLDLSTGTIFNVATANQAITFSNAPDVHSFKLNVVGAGATTPYLFPDSTWEEFKFTEDNSPTDIQFNADGSKMFMIGTQYDKIYEYDLTTPYNLLTASYTGVAISLSVGYTPSGMAFSNDGTKLFVLDGASDNMYSFTLPSFDIANMTQDSTTPFNFGAQVSLPKQIRFNSDGTRLYMSGAGEVHQYSMTASYDLSTLSWDGLYADVSGPSNNAFGLAFNSTGDKMYVYGSTDNAISEYTLSDLDDISSAAYTGFSYSLASDGVGFNGLIFNGDGTRLYSITSRDEAVVYDLPVAYNLPLIQNPRRQFDVGSQSTYALVIAFNGDGTRLYVSGRSDGNKIYQYDLSEAYQVNTAVYNDVFFVANEASISGISFNNDGTIMHIVGYSIDKIYQYALVDYDLSTAVYNGVEFDSGSQENYPWCLIFNDDGLKMYVVGSAGDDINQYALTSEFDITTASVYGDPFSVASEDNFPRSIAFNADGSELFMTGQQNDTLYKYTLTTNYEVSTMSYSGFSMFVGDVASFVFNSAGTQIYMLLSTTIKQYDTFSFEAGTLTYPSTVKFPSTVAPDLPALNKVDVVELYTIDGGASYIAHQSSDNN
jgi:glutamine cyclotransferase